MKTNTPCSMTIAIALVFATASTADVVPKPPLDPRCAAVEAAFQEAKTTGDLSRV